MCYTIVLGPTYEKNWGDLVNVQPQEHAGAPGDLPRRLHQLRDGMIQVADGVEGASSLQRVGALEDDVELWK